MGMFASVNRMPPMQFVPPPPVAAMDLPSIDPNTNAVAGPGAPAQGGGGNLMDSIMKAFGGGAGGAAPGGAAGMAPGGAAPAAGGAAPAGGMDLSKIMMMFGGM